MRCGYKTRICKKYSGKVTRYSPRGVVSLHKSISPEQNSDEQVDNDDGEQSHRLGVCQSSCCLDDGYIHTPQSWLDELNKTFYRISIRWNNHFKLWDKWSAETGIKPETKQAIIETAEAHETYKSWYISEHNIPINDWVTIEDVRTGRVLFKWENKKFLKIN